LAKASELDIHKSRPAWLDPLAQPFIRIEGVTKKFGEFTAVQKVSLDIYKGELFALLGGSGCGKSTLLRMLAGFEMPTEGRIVIDGQDMAGIPPYERPVNMMFQSYALFPHMTVEKNVGYGLKHENMTDKERKDRVASLLDLVQLTPFAGRKPHQLSGGQKQRVALARALVVEPKVLLLDEPLGALDLKLRRQMQDELKAIQKRVGTTFVHVTHDQEEAMALADLLVVMNHGRIEDQGPPPRVYARPATKFVATFMGDSIIIEGSVEGILGDMIAVASPLGLLQVPGEAQAGAPVTLAIRPESIKPVLLRGYQCLGSLKLSELSFQGAFIRAIAHTPSGQELRLRLEPTSQLKLGDVIQASVRPEDIVMLSQ